MTLTTVVTSQNVDKPKRRQPKRQQTKTSTDQNVDKPKRRETEASRNRNVDRPKRRQPETSTKRNVDIPKRRQTKTSTDHNVDKPKRRQSKCVYVMCVYNDNVPPVNIIKFHYIMLVCVLTCSDNGLSLTSNIRMLIVYHCCVDKCFTLQNM